MLKKGFYTITYKIKVDFHTQAAATFLLSVVLQCKLSDSGNSESSITHIVQHSERICSSFYLCP